MLNHMRQLLEVALFCEISKLRLKFSNTVHYFDVVNQVFDRNAIQWEENDFLEKFNFNMQDVKQTGTEQQEQSLHQRKEEI